MEQLNNPDKPEAVDDQLASGFATLRSELPGPSQALKSAILDDAVRMDRSRHAAAGAKSSAGTRAGRVRMPLWRLIPTGILAASAILGVGAGYSMAEDVELAVSQLLAVEEPAAGFDVYSGIEDLLQEN